MSTAKILTKYHNELMKITEPTIGLHGTREVSPTVFIHGETLHVSAEDGGFFASYYGRTDDDDYPWIHEKLETWARSKGGYWEWDNPGSISLVI